VFFILNIAIGILGVEHPLINFGGISLAKYSDMNGYGHFLFPFVLIQMYWLSFGVLLLWLASLLMSRGPQVNFLNRLKAIRLLPFNMQTLALGVLATASFILLGGYIFYNTNILNQFYTRSEKQDFRANYEIQLKQFEYLPQPKIVEAKLTVDLHPSTRSYEAKGIFTLVNNSDSSIQEIHIQNHPDKQLKLSGIHFNR